MPKPKTRTVKAVHGRRKNAPDPAFELGLAASLRRTRSRAELIALYGRFCGGEDAFDALMRRVLLRSLAKRLGHGLSIGPGTRLLHPETFRIGSGVFVGAQSFIQGRFDGRCDIGDGTWIGPQSYFDARDLVIGRHVGWGPGAKVLGSAHTATPVNVPVIRTDLKIRTVRIGDWADVGTNAVILPGVTVGKGAVIGAGSIVTGDVPPFAVAAGVPAKIIRMRKDTRGGRSHSR